MRLQRVGRGCKAFYQTLLSISVERDCYTGAAMSKMSQQFEKRCQKSARLASFEQRGDSGRAPTAATQRTPIGMADRSSAARLASRRNACPTGGSFACGRAATIGFPIRFSGAVGAATKPKLRVCFIVWPPRPQPFSTSARTSVFSRF